MHDTRILKELESDGDILEYLEDLEMLIVLKSYGVISQEKFASQKAYILQKISDLIKEKYPTISHITEISNSFIEPTFQVVLKTGATIKWRYTPNFDI